MAVVYNGRLENGGRFGSSEHKIDHDKPPFSRVFIVCGKQYSGDDLRKKFEEYGSVEDVWVVKDKNTKENRGIAYIKFSKMSEACLAIESLDGKKLSEDDSGTLKVLMAQPKSSKSNEDFNDETALTRLFVVIPKGTTEDELRSTFAEYGDIEYVQIVKDRKTGEKKGFGYVKYRQAYDAAKAVEGVDKSYKAVIAEPKAAKIKREMATENHVTDRQVGMDWNPSYTPPARVAETMPVPSFGFQDGLRATTIGNRLQVNCSPVISADQLARLFDLIPGMELCDLKRNFQTGESKGIAIVVYNSVGSAIYAKEKLNGFEYPPGFKLTVRCAPDGETLPNDIPMGGIGPVATPTTNGGSYCSIPLPPAKPLANSETEECAERLFIVCHPSPPPPNVLVDVFSRFGDLLAVFMLKNKNFGYAKFASVEAAEQAMKTLHGAEILGKELKVLTAEPPKTAESARKRPRT